MMNVQVIKTFLCFIIEVLQGKKKYLQYIVVRESHPAIFTDPVLSKMSNEKVC